MKANTVPLPADFDSRDVQRLLQSLPVNGYDIFSDTQFTTSLVGPVLQLELARLFTGPALRFVEFDYELTLETEGEFIGSQPFADMLVIENTDIPLESIVYSQSSVYAENEPADVASMQDNEIGGPATGTDDGALEWVQMDFGAAYSVERVIVGTATEDMPGGWSKLYTENRDLEYSLDGEEWEVFENTGEFEDEGIYVFDVDFVARYIRIIAEDDYLGVSEFYALAPGQLAIWQVEQFSIFTGPELVADAFSDGDAAIFAGVEPPELGNEQVSPSTDATDNGWTAFSAPGSSSTWSASPDFVDSEFRFTLDEDEIAYAFVSAFGALVWDSFWSSFASASATVPASPKLHMGSGPFGMQKVYSKAEPNYAIIRYEGNSDPSVASTGSSDRIIEVTFYAPREDGSQVLEVRSGDIAGPVNGPFMLATASTALAVGQFASNQSWVFLGNADGTEWQLIRSAHVAFAVVEP